MLAMDAYGGGYISTFQAPYFRAVHMSVIKEGNHSVLKRNKIFKR